MSPPATIDATEVARKLLSAVFRTEMRFGVGHLADVLAKRVRANAAGFQAGPDGDHAFALRER